MRAGYALFHLAVLFGPVTVSLAMPRFRSFWHLWKPLLMTYAFVSVPWIAIDALSHARGWWDYDPAYVSGVEFVGLPIEEIVFFFTVPFACLFLWWALQKHWGRAAIPQRTRQLLIAGAVAIGGYFLMIGILDGKERTLFDAVLYLGVVAVIALSRLSREAVFWRWSAIVFVLFLMFNSILTALPIVVYDESFMTGWRIGTIPIEDTLYNFVFLWLSVTMFEYARGKGGALWNTAVEK